MASPRLSLRVSDSLLQRLADQAPAQGVDLSTLVRDTLMASLTGPPMSDTPATRRHDPDACARVILDRCSPETQTCLANAMARCATRSVLAVLPGILHHWAELMRDPRLWQAWRP